MLINILYGEYESVITLMQDYNYCRQVTQVLFYPVTELQVDEFGIGVYKNPLLVFLN